MGYVRSVAFTHQCLRFESKSIYDARERECMQYVLVNIYNAFIQLEKTYCLLSYMVQMSI